MKQYKIKMNYSSKDGYYLVNVKSENKEGIHGDFKVMPDDKKEYSFLKYKDGFITDGFFSFNDITFIEEVK